MAGYKRKRKTINVSFEEGHPYAGFEATLRGLTTGEWLSIIGVGEVDRSSIDDGLRMMAAGLISWNLEDEDGHPVPATLEAVLGEDKDLMIEVFNGWLDAVHNGVKKNSPLPQSSPAGEPSPQAPSIPMEPLSASLAS